MKYGKYIVLAFILFCGFLSCQQDEDITIAVLKIHNEVIEPSYTTVDIECFVECNTKFSNVLMQYALTDDFFEPFSTPMQNKDGKYHARCVNLLDDTTYYVRYIVSNRYSSMVYDKISSFRTLTPSIPIVVLDSIVNIWDVKADAIAHVAFDGGAPILEWGICLSADKSADTTCIKAESLEEIQITLENLQPNTAYQLRAYAINKVGTAYSDELSILTYALPEVQTNEITDIQLTSALLSGTLIFDGNDSTTEKGFCWSNTASPMIDDYHVLVYTADSNFAYNLTNLKDETQYFVRAYAKNKIGISHGTAIAFTTQTAVVPMVSSLPVSNISYTSATLAGEVVADGGAEVTERGICYSTSENPTKENSPFITSGKGIGSFSVNLTNLTDSTTYYYRAYAINKKGISYGEQVSFMTKGYKLPTVNTTPISAIEYHTAKGGGNITEDGGAEVTERGICYSTSENPTKEMSKVVHSGRGTGSFTINLTTLSDSTTYYVRAYAINKKGISYGEQVSFMTKGYKLPTVTTIKPTNISYTSATVGGNVGTDGDPETTERGICYSTSENPTLENSPFITSGKGTGSFSVNLEDLTDSTTYYVRAYAINKKGVAYGDEQSFMTKGYKLPTVSTIRPTNISYTSATIGGSVTADGGTEVIKRGICYSTSENPTKENSPFITSGKGIGSFSVNLPNLTDSTTYYYRAYAINKKGISYGEQVSFMTKGYKLPTVNTIMPTNISYTSATVGGNVGTDADPETTERGICYSLSPNPTTENTKIISGKGAGSFFIDLTNLVDNTTYYVRAYAINMKGTSYGKEVSFSTKGYALATITTSAPTNVSYTSATIGGTVISNGGLTVTERGMCYSTTKTPTIESRKVTAGSGDGTFTINLTDLADGTTYYARSYAINQRGVAYGEEISFTTNEYKLPTITTTTPPSNISYTSATVGGSVIADGGLEVTERGICYSTMASPTIENIKIASGKGLGSFSINLTNLSNNTTYYVRAYAKNSKGIAYGDEVSFTTVEILLPTITTKEATNIFNTSAIVGGNITNDGGGDVTERGVVYNTSPNPTISNTKVAGGNGIGEFTCNLTNLQSGTTYYVRAYAENVNGTAYGQEISFTTMTTLNFPITTTSATDITCTSAVVGGSITGDGGSAITERGVCYSTSPAPTMSDMTMQKGRGVGAFVCTLTDLQDGVTYYVRAYGINSLGISYGDEVSFTTIKKSLPTITIVEPTKYSTDDATIEAEVTYDGCLDVTTRGVVFSTSPNPTIVDNKVTNGEGVGAFSCLLSNLQEATTYYVRAYAENEKGVAYSDEKSFTTRSKTYHDGYEYVDLGLSVMWATHNVGTTTIEGTGDYFAWGEVEPKTTYSWNTYDYCEGTEKTMTKYCTDSNYGVVDNKKYLEPIDDAAHANWGGDWRMPTGEEMQELMNQCTWMLTTNNGTRGYKITSKINGNTIFMPSTTGYKDGSRTTYSGSYGYFYSSSLSSSTSSYYIDCGNSNTNIHLYNGPRYYGRTVRPVWSEMKLPTVITGSLCIVSNIITINKNNVTTTGGAPVTECGIVYCTLPNPTISDTKIPAGSGIGAFTCTLTDLQDGLTYYARAYATNQKGTAYGEEISFTYVAPKYEHGYEYVDLGLSVKWATMNVGASTPEGYGEYFAWGEVEPKTTYNWSTYKWCNGTSSTMTKYCNNSTVGNNGFTDNLTQLESEDDAATVNWGGNWRMPTDAEITELRENCTWTWTIINEVKGYVVTGPNRNSIFLPATGCRDNDRLQYVGVYGHYWSNSLYASSPVGAWRLIFNNNIITTDFDLTKGRAYAQSVRPVCP